LKIGFVNFSSAESHILHGDFSAWKIEGGTEFEIVSHGLLPADYLVIKIEDITLTPLLPRDLSGLELTLTFNSANKSDFGYSSTFSVLNRYGISVASRHYFTVRLNEYDTSPRYEDRVGIPSFLTSLVVVAAILCMASLALVFRSEARWFPFISTFLIWIALFVYVFLGSWHDVEAKNWSWLGPLSVFFHGDNNHISYNLFYFAVLSVAFESFAKLKEDDTQKDTIVYYAFLLFSPVLWALATRQGAYGLSYSIEAGTWALWAYIVANHCLIKNRLTTLVVIVSGVPIYTLLGWVLRYALGGTYDPWDMMLSVGHIEFGIASGACVGVVFVGRKVKSIITSILFHDSSANA
jgi:hypothetical protein